MNVTVSIEQGISLLARWFGLFAALFVVACWTSPATAQFDGLRDLNGLKQEATPRPEFTTTLTPAGAKPGDIVTLTINVKLPKGYYIYSTTGEFDGRTRIETEPTGLEPVDAEFVPDREPKTIFEPLLRAEVSKFDDHVEWKKRYRVSQDADPATVAVKIELSGNYCT